MKNLCGRAARTGTSINISSSLSSVYPLIPHISHLYLISLLYLQRKRERGTAKSSAGPPAAAWRPPAARLGEAVAEAQGRGPQRLQRRGQRLER